MIPKPGRDGFYRCPNRCGNPDFPPPKWKTEKGIEGHLEKCPMKPLPAKPVIPKRFMGLCPTCKREIWEDDTIWSVGGVPHCIAHWRDFDGFMDCAGLDLGGDLNLS